MKDKTISLADELESVLEKREALLAELQPLEEREAEIRTEIVRNLLKKGLQYIKTSSGLAFGLVKGRVSYKIRDGMEEEALRWAKEEYPGVLSISAARLNQVVKPMLEPPEFVERHEGETTLRITERP